MKRTLILSIAICALLASAIYAFGDIARPKPTPVEGKTIFYTGLTVVPDSKSYEARLQISQETLKRIQAAGARGMYVSVMLFEGWEVQFVDAWTCHPFHANNNVNHVDADTNRDGRGLEYYTLQPDEMGKRVLEFQRAYLRKVIDTVNDLDNVLYEVCNEAGAYSTAWQYDVIRFVHEYEAEKPKQHPVGMTSEHPGGVNREPEHTLCPAAIQT